MTSRGILLRMRNASEKFLEKIKTHFLFNNHFFEYRAVYEIIWKNTEEPARLQVTI
jgi:hypothetical protein